MAAAEARAVWQRTANRCFVQEDAKRAPKLACCPSTSSSSAKQADTGPASAADGQDNCTSAFAPLSGNSSCSNLSPDSRWWLQLQPNYLHQRGLTNEQVNAAEARNSHQFVDNENDSVKNGFEVTKKDLETLDLMDSQTTRKGGSLDEQSYEFVEMDSVDSCAVKELDEFSLDSTYPHWMGSEKSHELPWWRTNDKDDLASFVAQRSHKFIENCDLPQPLSTSFKSDPYAHVGRLDEKDGIFTSFGSLKPQRVECPNVTTVHRRCDAITGIEVQSIASKPVSPVSTERVDSAVYDGSREMSTPEMDTNKAKLLEALRHSQTRAREAEMAAKEAHAEKEHVVRLIFKQASQLFAYKQWFYLLQLENLYYQIKNNKSQPISSIFPVTTPWEVPCKSKKVSKKQPPHAKGKIRAEGLPRCEHNIGKYAVVFVVGLGLVGAGLLFGWTMGWMLI